MLFVPVVDEVTDDVYHDRTFWGIRFPIRPFSPDKAVVDVIQEYLEGGGDAVLEACLEGLDEATVSFAVVIEVDRKFIEHKIGFFYNSY
jgi:hypothetical protein